MTETKHVKQEPAILTSEEGAKLINYFAKDVLSYRFEDHDPKNDVITFRKKEPDGLTDIKVTVAPGGTDVEKIEIDHKSPEKDLSIELTPEAGTKEQEAANNLFNSLPS
ncbi:MAG: hypothetical protein A2Y25_09440 [Candidatus Melainabacteria bacterium GWF2_37_15]|nr:MAG: hypothetical protein A2Y25_09440 [Candidatus Melainabacteria bacterium GWF2_37_15]